MKSDMPLLIRGSADLVLFTISTAYIIHNKIQLNKIQVMNEGKNEYNV